MGDSKRFYWIKLKNDFFDLPTIDFLQDQKNGCEYIVLYEKLCLLAANNDGQLVRQVGELVIPYDAKKISELSRFKYDTVIVALELYKKIGLIIEQEDGVFSIPAVKEMTGSESKWAERKRLQRDKKKDSGEDEVQKVSTKKVNLIGQNEDNVQSDVQSSVQDDVLENVQEMQRTDERTNADTLSDKRLEYRDKSIENNKIAAGDGRARTHECNSHANIVDLFQNVIHPIANMAESDRINELADEYGDEWLSRAIKEAGINRAGTIRYVEAILDRWRSSGSQEPWKERKHEHRDREQRSGRPLEENQGESSSKSSDNGGIDWSRFDDTYRASNGAG